MADQVYNLQQEITATGILKGAGNGSVSPAEAGTDYVAPNDSRLTDARTPTAHKSSHATGGGDALSPSDIGAAAASHTHVVSDITKLATVATSGSYNDLLNKPSIPAAQVQADWNKADTTDPAYIKNKPSIPTVPAISTDIGADATSDAKTASPKAVKTFVEGKGYQANVIESVEVDGSALSPSDKAVKVPLRYDLVTIEVPSNNTPSFSLSDRASMAATLGASVTAATITLPAATAGKARDFLLALTIEATATPTITFIDPATQTTPVYYMGEAQLADIDTGMNMILFTERPGNTWFVSVRHEEASA